MHDCDFSRLWLASKPIESHARVHQLVVTVERSAAVAAAVIMANGLKPVGQLRTKILARHRL